MSPGEQERKVCADCKHKASIRVDVCFHPKSFTGPSLVHHPSPPGYYNDDEWHSCYEMRNAGAPCGREGLLFEAWADQSIWPWAKRTDRHAARGE